MIAVKLSGSRKANNLIVALKANEAIALDGKLSFQIIEINTPSIFGALDIAGSF